jgi:CheY-like chemotaxis protein
MVRADPGQIQQIVMNLVVNARDAMPQGGRLTIETSDVYLDEEYTRVTEDVETGAYAMFAVSDTGEGMDPGTVARIFDPFFTTKEKDEGTGLGLSTVYGIVKQHKGHVSVYSNLGLGSTFKVYLPRITSPSLPEQPKASTSPIKSHGDETVLVVEDEAIVRDLACELLGILGYTALEAGDPDEAIAVCDQHEGKIHLLLTDVVLPKMDGKSLFDRIAPTRPEMKVLFMSGYTDDAIVHHGVLDRGVHFLQKPFTTEILARKVREALDDPSVNEPTSL